MTDTPRDPDSSAPAPRASSRQVHPRHRRRRLLARQGPGGGVHRRAARRSRLQGHAPEVRPLHQRRSGHDEPVPARRGLRHRRRRRDRPRPGPLRALHQPGHDPEQQLDDRQDLPVGHQQGAPRRLSRPHGAGDSRTSPTRSRTASARSPRTSTSCSSRLAARSATSRACRSSKRSASCGRTSAARTPSTST